MGTADKTIAQEFAHFAKTLTYESIPEDVREKIKTILLHDLCVCLSVFEPEADNLPSKATKVLTETAVEEATLLAYGRKTSVENAAFVSSVMFHTRQQEDSYGTAHVGTVCIPLAIALAENRGKSGKELLTALIAGYEVATSMARDYFEKSAALGYRPTPVFGIFAATTAAGLLLDLTEEELVNAYAFTHAFVCGPASLQSGLEATYTGALPAINALWAVKIAKAGGLGNPACMEYKRGFFPFYCGEEADAAKVTAQLGKTWEMLKVMQKKYPSDMLNQAHIRSMSDLMKENGGIDHRQIKSVTLEGAANDVNDSPGIRYAGPFNTYTQASVSCIFSVCSLLVHGACTFENQSKLDNPDTLALVAKTKLVPNENLQFLCSRITVEMEDGTLLKRALDITPDFFSPSFAEKTENMCDMADELPIPQAQLDTLIQTIGSLEKDADMSGLLHACTVK